MEVRHSFSARPPPHSPLSTIPIERRITAMSTRVPIAHRVCAGCMTRPLSFSIFRPSFLFPFPSVLPSTTIFFCSASSTRAAAGGQRAAVRVRSAGPAGGAARPGGEWAAWRLARAPSGRSAGAAPPRKNCARRWRPPRRTRTRTRTARVRASSRHTAAGWSCWPGPAAADAPAQWRGSSTPLAAAAAALRAAPPPRLRRPAAAAPAATARTASSSGWTAARATADCTRSSRSCRPISAFTPCDMSVHPP